MAKEKILAAKRHPREGQVSQPLQGGFDRDAQGNHNGSRQDPLAEITDTGFPVDPEWKVLFFAGDKYNVLDFPVF